MPALDGVVEEHGVDGLAHRVVAAEAEGRRWTRRPTPWRPAGAVDPARGLDEVDRVVACSSMPVAMAKMLGSKMMSSGGKPTRRPGTGRRARRSRSCAGRCRPDPFVEGHHHRGGAVAADQSGLALELVDALLHRDRIDDAFALRQRRPASITAHFGVDHHRHARDVGLAGDQVQKAHHRGLLSSMASSMLTSMIWAPFSPAGAPPPAPPRTFVEDHAREGLGAGDVGALADVDEQASVADASPAPDRTVSWGKVRRRDRVGGNGIGHGTHLENRTGERRCIPVTGVQA